MQNVYTTIDYVDGKYVAIVFDANTNQELYKSNPYKNQLRATQDVNNFLASQNTKTPNTPSGGATIVNTFSSAGSFKTSTPPPTHKRRCCGR